MRAMSKMADGEPLTISLRTQRLPPVGAHQVQREELVLQFGQLPAVVYRVEDFVDCEAVFFGFHGRTVSRWFLTI